MRLEDYQSYSQPVFSRSAKIAIGILVVILLLVPINIAPLGQRLFRGALSLYTVIVDSPQELVETHLSKKLNLHLTYNEDDPARILQKRQHQGWLLKNWLFWGPFFVLMFPLSLLFCVGFIRKVKDLLSRSRLLESYEGALLWEIKDKVRRVSWRINFFNWEKAFIYVFIMGLILFTGQFAAQFFVNLSFEMMQSLLLSFLIYTIGIYTFYLYYNRFSQKKVAEIIDSRMGLKERLVTSMEEPQIPTPLYSVVLEETSQELRQQDMESLAPHRFPQPNKKGVLGMLLFTLFLATLISAATPHAAILAKSYQNYVKELSLQEKKQKININKVEKTIRREGKVLKELVDEFESDSDDVKFFLEETRHLAQQMSSVDVDKMEVSMQPSQSSKSDSLSDVVSPEDEQPKKTKKKRNKEYGKEVKISKRSLSIEANQYHRRNNKDFSQISGELSEIAMEMIKERKNIPNNHKNLWQKNFHRKDLINNLQGVEEFQEDNFDNNTDDEGEPDENSGEVDNLVQKDSSRSGKTDTFGEKQKDGVSDTFSLKSPSRVKEEKNQLQKKKIDIKTLKSLMEKIFAKKEEKRQATEEKKGKQVDQKNTPEQQAKAKLEKKSLNNLLDQTPSIFRQQKPQKNQKDEHSQTKPSSHDQTLYASPKETKEKTTMSQSNKQKSVREFPTNNPNRKNVVILDNPGNIEIAKETFEDISDEDADWYLQDWIRDSQDTLPSFTNTPVGEDTKRSVVLGKKVDILYKNFLVINNPSNIKDPRPEMRDAVVSVNSPNFIRGLPKKLSHFVKDVTDPKKIEGLSSQLDKLGKDLDDWERANSSKTARYRYGTSQQQTIGVQANWSDEKVEMGNYDPTSNKNTNVVRGSKINRSMNDSSEKFRVEGFPKHLSPHKKMTNISLDLANLGRELIDIEKVQRRALLGRNETSSDSISTDNRKDLQNKFKGKLNKTGRQFKGLGDKLEQLTDSKSLQAFTKRMADQSQHLGNMLLGFAQSSSSGGTTGSTKANKQVQNTLKENKKALQEMAEQIRDSEFKGYGSNFSSRLARLASKTGDLANQPSLSKSGDPIADDFIRKSLLQKAEGIEQLTEDLRQRNPKNNKEMARRFSKLAREMENLNQGFEQGKLIGKKSELDTIKKGLRQKGKKVELLSEEIKQGKEPMWIKEMASQLSQTTEEMVNLQKKLGKYPENQPTLNRSQNKLSQLKDIGRKIRQQTNPQQLQKLANQMGEMAQDLKFSLDAQTAISQELNETNRQHAEKLIGKKSELDKIQKVEFLSEEIKQGKEPMRIKEMASQLSQATEEMVDLQKKLGKYPGKQATLNRSQNKLSLLKGIDRKIRKQTDPQQLQKLASQMGEMAQDLKFSLDVQTAISQELDETNRQHAEKLGKQFLQLSKKMQKETNLKELQRLANQMTDSSQAMQNIKNQPQAFTQDKRISEQLKLTGNRLTELAQYTKDSNLNLDKLVRKVDKSAKQFDRLLDQSKDMQKKYAPEIGKVAGKLEMVRQELKELQNSGFRQESMTQQTREYIRKQQAQLKDVAQRIQQDPAYLSQAAEKLKGISEEIGRTAKDGTKKLDKNAANRLNKSASKIKKLAENAKQTAESQQLPIFDLVKASEEAMKDTMKKIDKITKTISDNPIQARQKEKELATSSLEMEKLSRLMSLLEIDRTAPLQQQQKIKEAQDKLQNLSRELQQQTDPNKLRNLAQKTQQVSKDLIAQQISKNLIALSNNQSIKDQDDRSLSSAGWLKKMAEEMSKNKKVTAARRLSKDLDGINRQLNPANRSDSSKLSKVKEKLDKLITKIEYDGRQKIDREAQQAKLSQEINKLAQEIQQGSNPKKLEKLSSQLTQLANQTGEMAQDLKFSLNAQTVTSQKLIDTNRQHAEKLGKQFLQLSKKMPQETSLKELRELAGQMTDASQAKQSIKNQPHISTQDKRISEQLKLTGNQLTELAKYTKSNNLNLDKLVRKIDKSAKQLDRLTAQSKDMQKKYAPEIDKVSGKLEMIRQELRRQQSSNSRQESMTPQTREYIRKQKAQLKDVAQSIQQDPTNLNQAAEKLQEISEEIVRTTTSGKKKLDKNATNRLNKSASQIKKLAGDMKQVAEDQKIPVSELVKTSEEAMKDTMKKIEKITKTISDNPSQASQKGKELAKSSLEMEKLSRLQSLLGVDQTASLQQQQKIKKARDKLQKLSKELQQQTDPNKLQNLAQKTQQISKDLIALSKNQSTHDQPDRNLSSALWLKEMAEKLSENKNVATARSLSKGLDGIIRQHNPDSRSNSSKLSNVKEKLDNLITEIEYDRRQETDRKAQPAELSQEINNLAQEIQRENNPKKLEKLSSQLTQLANQMDNQILGENNDTTGFLSKNLNQALTKTQQVTDRLSEKIKKRLNSKKIKEEAKELDRQAEKTAKLILIEKERYLKSSKLQKDIEKTVWRARKISQEIQNEKEAQNLKKYTSELNKISEQIVVMTMEMNNSSGKQSLKESIREVVENTGKSLQKITKRLNENIELNKVSSDLMKLSKELSNLDLGGKKKTDSEENITKLDKKIINETANKLKELSYKTKSLKNPKDVRQMATDLLKLSGNLKNLDMSKSEQQGTKSTSTVSGQNTNPRTNKLKHLAKQLKDASNIDQTKTIAAQMSKLVTKLSKQDMKQSYKTAGENRNKRQEDSESFFKKILDLPQFFSQDKKIKEQKNKSTKAHDQNDMTRKATVDKIDKLIKTLKRQKKKLPGVYNSKRVLKKAGVSSKGTGNVQKGIMGKMTRSNYNMAKFTDSDVSKDVNTLPKADFINNTYVMEKNLTDRQVFERIINRLEKNREHILAEGKTSHKVMPSKKLPLIKDYQSKLHKPAKQPIKGSNSRRLAGLGVPDTVKIPKDPPVEEKPTPNIPNKSYMEKEKHTASMKVSIKMDKKDTNNLPKDRLKKRTQQEPSRFNEFQAEDDSVIGQNVPGEYQDIIKELYTQVPESY